ncbi:hypothetical protein GCM10023107_57040 [Actinoplanes octamycinicus]|nr:hypothetical protein Aoc01nite_51230 [Actinoplanes octamycinicus]
MLRPVPEGSEPARHRGGITGGCCRRTERGLEERTEAKRTAQAEADPDNALPRLERTETERTARAEADRNMNRPSRADADRDGKRTARAAAARAVGAGRLCDCGGTIQISQRFFWTSGRRAHKRPRPQVCPA